MFENAYVIVGIFSVLIILSYFYSYIARHSVIPSVLLLLLTGIITKLGFQIFNIEMVETRTILEIFGIIGLILIVLEGALELKFERSKVALIRRSFLSALIMLFVSSLLIAGGINLMYMELEFRVCFLNAIPFAVISSAIAIPTVARFSEEKKEFLIYESIFSDILGILLFNIILNNPEFDLGSAGFIAFDLLLTLILSLLLTIILLFFLDKSKMEAKFILMISVLVLLYDIGKLLHLSSLLIILIFGLLLNNIDVIWKNRMSRYFNLERVKTGLEQFRSFTGELSFLIRTLFFFIFGFSFHLVSLTDSRIMITGFIIIGLLYLIRYVYLRTSNRFSVKPEIYIAPRGLITILLFYSIPKEYSIGLISEGVLFMVILVSSLVMIFGMLNSRRTEKAMNPEMEVFVGDQKIDTED